MIASEKAAGDSKQKIRTRYKGVDPSELEVIPAIATDEIALEQRPLKVAAYVRVSTENDEQTSSYELQVNDFTERIKANPNWEFVGIYSDEGISGTSLTHRKGMMETIKIVAKLAEEESKAKSNARVYTVDQARDRMSRQEGDFNRSSPDDGTRIVPRELLRNTKRKTEK